MRKRTNQREAIHDCVNRSESHLTAAEIYEQVRRTLPTIGFATIYRNLRTLVDEGSIAEIRSGDVTRYDRHTERHDHAICQRCGKLLDIEVPVPEMLLKHAVSGTGFQFEEYRIELRGVCRDCL